MLSQRGAVVTKPTRDVKKRVGASKAVPEKVVTPTKGVADEVRVNEVVLGQNEGEIRGGLYHCSNSRRSWPFCSFFAGRHASAFPTCLDIPFYRVEPRESERNAGGEGQIMGNPTGR